VAAQRLGRLPGGVVVAVLLFAGEGAGGTRLRPALVVLIGGVDDAEFVLAVALAGVETGVEPPPGLLAGPAAEAVAGAAAPDGAAVVTDAVEFTVVPAALGGAALVKAAFAFVLVELFAVAIEALVCGERAWAALTCVLI